MSQTTDLQHAINRFFGNLIGSPIAEDGIVGPQTTDAVNAIVAGLPDLNYAAAASAISASFASGNYLGTTAALNAIADDQNWLYDAGSVTRAPTFVSGGASPVPVKPIATVQPSSLTAGLNSVASQLGLPMWAMVGGVAVAGLILFTARPKRGMKKGRSR